jgi:glucose-6-phosphate 1-dehydrogenase
MELSDAESLVSAMSNTIVIFGASGDLTSRKLVPALYELHRKRRLPEPTRIIGFSRTPFSHEAWREVLAESTARHVAGKFDRPAWEAFAPSIFYHPGDVSRADDFVSLKAFLEALEGDEAATRVYYLATAPQSYRPAIGHLGEAGLALPTNGPRRVVVEKPFGSDGASARALNEAVHQVFSEGQVYRIDHYLGKETVQNVLVFRFANAIFEPVWNRNYIDHVQITAAEEVTVGRRGAYYDSAGVLRDMFQNHLLQLLALTAMEAPARFEADAIRDEKVKVFRAIRPMRPDEVAAGTVRGQYRQYRDEPNVPPDSQTATFAGVRLGVDNWRWQGVPFYLRSGKAMSCRSTQIVIQFRQPPHMVFEGAARGPRQANRLVIQIQPAEGIQVQFQTKVPDAGMQLRLTDLDFRFQEEFAAGIPDAYQRLLLDVMLGDASLFARSDEVEVAWGIIDPIAQTWVEQGEPELCLYEAGQWGPLASTEWMRRQQREWFDACPVLHGSPKVAEV